MDLSERTSIASRRHPWEAARYRFFSRLLRDAGLLADAHYIVDVGAGDGWFSRRLLQEECPAGSEITCWDIYYTDEDLDDLRSDAPAGLHFTRGAPPQRARLALALDVIEHVEDDAAFVATIVDQVEPGGRVLVSVPAWQPLFARHDVALRHFRRYSPTGLRDLLQGAGLTVLSEGGLFHSLLVPRLAKVLWERLVAVEDEPPRLDDWNYGPVLSAAVDGALAIDTRVSRLLATVRIQAPGLSTWALCQTPV